MRHLVSCKLTFCVDREIIQAGTGGHDSVEDATATMKLVQHKLKHRMWQSYTNHKYTTNHKHVPSTALPVYKTTQTQAPYVKSVYKP